MNKPFSMSAKLYDKLYNDRPYMKDYIMVKPFCEPWKRVLNVGCGTGRLEEYLRHVCDVTGIDVSKEMLEIAEERFSHLTEAYKPKFVLADILDYRDDEKFDTVISMFDSLSYIDKTDAEAMFCNVFDLIKPKGMFIFEVWNKNGVLENPPEVRVLNKNGVERTAVPTVITGLDMVEVEYTYRYIGEDFSETHNMHYYSKSELDILLHIAGFAEVIISETGKDNYHLFVIAEK